MRDQKDVRRATISRESHTCQQGTDTSIVGRIPASRLLHDLLTLGEVVDAFIDSYLESHAMAVGGLAGRVCPMAGAPEEQTSVRARYDAEIAQAAEFMQAEDMAAEERLRRRRIRAAVVFIESYRELPLLAWPREILDGVVAVEQAYVIFRQRHARMAERIIGRRVGTGGSTGVDYLDEGALRYRVFHDLWVARTLLVRRDRLPDPISSEFYGFQFETG